MNEFAAALVIDRDEILGHAVNARDLHQALASRQEFANWVKGRLEEIGAVENEDFVVFDHHVKNRQGGRPRLEYALRLDIAKEIAMLERNDRGKAVRKYFIECERRLRQPALPDDPISLALYTALENRKTVLALEAKLQDLGAARAAELALTLINSLETNQIYRAARALGRAMGGRWHLVWSEFNKHFQIAQYRDLPRSRFPEALTWLNAWYEDLRSGSDQHSGGAPS